MNDLLSRAYDRFACEVRDEELDALNRVFQCGCEVVVTRALFATQQEIAVAEKFLTTLEEVEREYRNDDPGEH